MLLPKKAYRKPAVVRYGDIHTLTKVKRFGGWDTIMDLVDDEGEVVPTHVS
jgi:hypothetical protein